LNLCPFVPFVPAYTPKRGKGVKTLERPSKGKEGIQGQKDIRTKGRISRITIRSFYEEEERIVWNSFNH
jgi:hypothetical protein